MSRLGPSKNKWRGRFGNQFFKYAFLRIYAAHYQLEFETNPWVGQYLFGHRDPQITHSFPRIKISKKAKRNLFKHNNPPYVNVDFSQNIYKVDVYRPLKKQIISYFQPTEEVYSMVNPGLVKLRKKGKTIVGIHIRRGDYLKYNNHPKYWAAPSKWYLNWLEQLWPTLKDPVLFIASDDLTNVISDFKSYDPVTSKELIPHFPLIVPSHLDASFYPDYYLLTQCDYLAISNSTFSFSASMLNTRCKIFMRPDLSSKSLVKYDPWNSRAKLTIKTPDKQ
ncbi:alpha-1,2-fucosyltransferase [Paenibacillus sedimenti]|uniref:Alpha-1,2-fucosyltransferase n=1 Tax=Paenibacillus sedimenti TaxID=2770274 RepID=A0A926KRH6_9BACL|nr:alpha-1,2-fucosyltransferase [Paenibacillus sedimenti]MBD0381561.1 alpha-1,2-fucosyltransferase [Paenibacillus sedimenti]